MDFVNHTNEKFDLVFKQLADLSRDHEAMEANVHQLMATGQRHETEITDVIAKHSFLAMTDANFTALVSDRLDKLEIDVAVFRAGPADSLPQGLPAQTEDIFSLGEPVVAEATPLRHTLC